MQIFAQIALPNHVSYEDYTVRRHSAAGAVATAALYTWGLDPEAPGGQEKHEGDCVLAYDWSVGPYCMELTLQPGTVTEQELARIAGSLTLTGEG